MNIHPDSIPTMIDIFSHLTHREIIAYLAVIRYTWKGGEFREIQEISRITRNNLSTVLSKLRKIGLIEKRGDRFFLSPNASNLSTAGIKNDALGIKNDALGIKNDALGIKNDALGIKNDALGIKNDAPQKEKPNREAVARELFSNLDGENSQYIYITSIYTDNDNNKDILEKHTGIILASFSWISRINRIEKKKFFEILERIEWFFENIQPGAKYSPGKTEVGLSKIWADLKSWETIKVRALRVGLKEEKNDDGSQIIDFK